MIIELAQYVSTNLSTIMSGLSMAVFGIAVYESRDGFFLFRGQFRGKYGALTIFVLSLLATSLLSPMVDNFWTRVLPSIPPGQLIGLVLILGMLGVNKEAEWNYLDLKSLIAYGAGAILLLKPEIVYTVV